MSATSPSVEDGKAYIAASVAIGVNSGVVMSVSPLIVDALVHFAHLSLSQAGYIAAIETGGICVGTAFVLTLSKHASPRSAIMAGLLMMLVGNILSAGVTGFAGFAGIRFLTGFGCGLTMLFTALLARTSRPQRSFSIFMGANVLAVAAIGGGVPLVLGRWGIAGIYGLIGTISLLCLFGVKAIPGSGRVIAADRADCPVPPAARVKIDRRISTAFVMQFLFPCSLAMVWTFLASFGIRRGVDATALSFVVSIGWLLAGTAGSVAAGMIDGKLRASTLVVGSAAAFIAVIAVLWFAGGPTLFYLPVTAFIFLWSFSYPPLMNIMAQLDPSGWLATAGTLVQTAGFAVGPALGARMLQSLELADLAIAGTAGFLGVIAIMPIINRLTL